MKSIETDYLVIGSGAMGLAFVDTLLAETDATVTIVDRHGRPGGHWNDAYSFVRLHQPSTFYGVNSMQLGDNAKDTSGLNRGFHELASGPEISGYFDKLMNRHLLASGRVKYFPMSDYLGDKRFVSLLSGDETQVSVGRKVVDGTYFATSVPATHTPQFKIAGGVNLATPNDLPDIWQRAQARPSRYCVLGAGKTAMDACVWLLESGADPDAISWITPRDSWLMNRRYTQPGNEFFLDTVGAFADQVEALAQASSADDLFERLEVSGQMIRIDESVCPTMYHCATVSTAERALLRQIKDVVRMGRVRAITKDTLVLDQGRLPTAPDTLYIDCTASAIKRRVPVPVFQDGLITLQMVRTCQPTFSAALVAHVEASYDDEARKNQYCGVVSIPDTVPEYLDMTLASMLNQYQWLQDEGMRLWLRQSRLDGFSAMMAAVREDEPEKRAVLKRIRKNLLPAIGNIQTLLEQGRQANVA